MLTQLSEFETLEDAAADRAGNWQRWKNFMWFGASEMPSADRIMLGYTLGPESTLEDAANHETIAETFRPYMGLTKGKPGAQVDDFNSDFCGDRDLLKGFMVLVNGENGEVTEAFRRLYELAQRYAEDPLLDADAYARVNRRHLLSYVHGELPSICHERGIPFTDELTVHVVDQLTSEEVDFDRDFDALDAALQAALVA